MKVAIVGYNTCCLNYSGGVQVRVKKIYELLSKHNGIEVEYFRPMETDFDSIDIFHFFKLEPEYFNLAVRVKKRRKKIVISSIVPLCGGLKLDLFKVINKFPILTNYKMQQFVLNAADKVIAETYQEATFITKHYSIDADRIVVIPNGIDDFNYEGREIYEHIGGEKGYVLQVGLVHENKNQANTIKAIKGTGIDLVIIGGENNGDVEYINYCKEIAKGDEHIHFLGWIDNSSAILKSAYANAKVLVFPSYNETFGLVALEGAMAGCNVAMTNSLPIHDFHAFDDCWLFDPNNIPDMREKIISAFNSPKTEGVKKRVKEIFSWDKIIDEHIHLYSSLL